MRGKVQELTGGENVRILKAEGCVHPSLTLTETLKTPSHLTQTANPSAPLSNITYYPPREPIRSDEKEIK